tara:strand:- start:16849 stop:17097 length:249 start_codon:yes stop_codon:yes gene_type:complete
VYTLDAMRETVKVANERGYADVEYETASVDMNHLEDMLFQMETGVFSEGKINRWLGYAQGVLVANEILTLEDAMEINKKHAD